jgi:hypothetical protein
MSIKLLLFNFIFFNLFSEFNSKKLKINDDNINLNNFKSIDGKELNLDQICKKIKLKIFLLIIINNN